VHLPVTANAASVPEADEQDALVVTVKQDGSVFLGVNPADDAGLADKVKAVLAGRTRKVLYLKADERAPYASVVRVIDSARKAEVEGLTLLTAQTDARAYETRVSPKGLEMQMVVRGR
jgi:biopolymer transport protein ExbD